MCPLKLCFPLCIRYVKTAGKHRQLKVNTLCAAGKYAIYLGKIHYLPIAHRHFAPSKTAVFRHEDKIKVQLDFGKNQYMLDFIVNDFDGTVLVGSYKNAEYTVEQVPVSYLQNVIRG